MTDHTSREALLDAVERLSVAGSPSLITMRSVAVEAGVSVGLAYHHFDSKDDLFGQALDRMAARITARVGDSDAPKLLQLVAALESAPAFSRLITALVLRGDDVSGLMSGHPLITETLSEASEARAVDPPGVAGTLVLLALGIATYGPQLNEVLGRSRDDDRLAHQLSDLFDHMLRGSEVP